MSEQALTTAWHRRSPMATELPRQRVPPASRESVTGGVCGAIDDTGRRCYRRIGHEGECDYSPNFQLTRH